MTLVIGGVIDAMKHSRNGCLAGSSAMDSKSKQKKILVNISKSTNVDGAWKSYHDKSKYLIIVV